MEYTNQLWYLLEILIAAVLGGAIGFEREWLDKPAGLRTNMIIAGTSAFFIILGRYVIKDFQGLIMEEGAGVDPIRMLHAIIVGVSFLGAGTILKGVNGKEIKYLTTSATILMSSAIGISVALKQYVLAVGATLLVLIINRIFSYFGDVIARKSEEHE